MIYLASRYTDPDKDIMDYRYHDTLYTAAKLIEEGHAVISPIVHCHEMARQYNMPRDAGFWLAYNWNIFQACSSMFIIDAWDWQESKGVMRELEWATWLQRPVNLVYIENAGQCDMYISIKDYPYKQPALRPI